MVGRQPAELAPPAARRRGSRAARRGSSPAARARAPPRTPARTCAGEKAMPSQKPSTASTSPSRMRRAAASGCRPRRYRRRRPAPGGTACAPRKLVRTRTGRTAPDRPRHPQHPELGLRVEPVARLDLDRRHPLGDQRVDPRQRAGEQLRLVRRPRRPHRRDDAAAGPRDLLVARALEPHLELARPVAAEDDVGVAVDQRRRHQPPAEVAHRAPAGPAAPRRPARPRRSRPSRTSDGAGLDEPVGRAPAPSSRPSRS